MKILSQVSTENKKIEYISPRFFRNVEKLPHKEKKYHYYNKETQSMRNKFPWSH